MRLILTYKDTAQKDAISQISQRSHLKNIPGIQNTSHVQEDTTQNTIRKILSDFPQENLFILSADSTFLQQPFSPFIIRRRTTFAKRKPAQTQRMINTMQFLFQGNYDIHDYELHTPFYFTRQLAEPLLAIQGIDNMLFRTLYSSIHFGAGLPTEDPYIETWSHNLAPTTPLVSLSETALRHPKCLKWIQSLSQTK